MSILKINDVVKKFTTKTAVDGITLDIEKGQIFGLLGPNGAGKTTLIRMITRIFNPDSGHIEFNEQSINDDIIGKIGYMPEERGLYKKMKVGEHLLYIAQLKGLSYQEARASVIAWMKKFEMQDWWNKRIDELSKGMGQKVQFVSTVAHNPQLIVLDEPFSGLDPVNTQMIKNEIQNLKENGVTIIFSTHRMEQVEEICEEIALINNGKVILNGDVKEIKNRFKQNEFTVEFRNFNNLDINSFGEIKEQSNDRLTLKLSNDQKPNSLLKYLIDNDVEICSFNELLPSLNDIFINLVTKK